MSPNAIRELIEAMRPQYRAANKVEKGLILGQLADLTGYNRKSLIRLFRTAYDPPKKRPGRPPVYHNGAFVTSLLLLWEASGYVCSKYLKAIMPELMEMLQR